MSYPMDEYVVIDVDARMADFWQRINDEVSQLAPDIVQLKNQDLPLARIKKIMKLDDDVKHMMISAEAPVILAKAAEIFVRELTLRAWLHTERCRRRTLQRIDVSMAIYDGQTDQFDFLIDIVPREDVKAPRKSQNVNAAAAGVGSSDQSALLDVNQSVVVANESINQNLPFLQYNTNNTQQLNTSTVITDVPQQLSGGGGGGVIASQLLGTPQAAGGTTQIQLIQQGGGNNSQPIQYVLQLPAHLAASNQPIQIQLMQPTSSSGNADNSLAATLQLAQTPISATSTILTNEGDNNKLVQVINIPPSLMGVTGGTTSFPEMGQSTSITLLDDLLKTPKLEPDTGPISQSLLMATAASMNNNTIATSIIPPTMETVVEHLDISSDSAAAAPLDENDNSTRTTSVIE